MPTKDPRLVPYGGGNYGMPLAIADGLIVPNDRFFVRCNGPVPQISREDWLLDIAGHVSQRIGVDFQVLSSLDSVDLVAFLECAGNGRTFHSPPTDGTPWLHDAAGNAKWRGVPLRSVLELADPLPGAVDVVAWGADLDNMGRALPLSLAHDPAFMLAYEMNDEPLPPEHGGPVRLIAPGWAGIASTKWVTRLEVLDRPFTGHYQGTMYTVYDAAETPLRPVREMPVKSLIATPVETEQLRPGDVEIRGYAWSGYGGITSVEVSTDGGHEWAAAEITASAGPRSWSAWRYIWQASAGNHILCSRATDQRGFTQPVQAEWNARGYLYNAIHRVPVVVG